MSPAEGPQLPDLARMIARAAAADPRRLALVVDGGTGPVGEAQTARWGELGRRVSLVASALAARGIGPGDRVGLIGESTTGYVELLLGTVRAGACVVPLPQLVAADSLQRMIDDAQLRLLAREEVSSPSSSSSSSSSFVIGSPGGPFEPLEAWLGATDGDGPPLQEAGERAPFDILYSSGTTSEPKGIVHGRRMRAFQIARMARLGLGDRTVALLATPLCSNATLIALLPTLACGGTAVLMRRFDPLRFFELSVAWRASATLLVPTQYARLLSPPGLLERFDLSRLRLVLCTGDVLTEAAKRELLARWPGRLVEIYGQTEGGCTTVLDAAAHPDKLATVGQAAAGVDLRVIDEAGSELPRGEVGEIVGRAASMMDGYFGRPDLTERATWCDAAGRAFVRTGDLGRLDADGFLHLAGRSKDVIISSGVNVYPIDLERVLAAHPAVAEAAVVGVPCPRRGEAPVAVVVSRPEAAVDPERLASWANARLGPVQRIASIVLRRSPLPRNALGKLLARQLRREIAGCIGIPKTKR